MKKINQEQIEDLYAFTIKHYVEYYDLQTELVDHMANDIEHIWESNPDLSYYEARKKAFKKFGIFGFMEVVEHRQKAMSKRYIKLLWKELKTWFSIPKLMITLSWFILFYLCLSSVYSEYFFMGFYLSILFGSGFQLIQLNRQYRKRREQSNKKWLLEDILFRQYAGVGIIFISQIYNVFNISEKFLANDVLVVISALVYTTAVLLAYISFKLLPSKADDILKDTYPEFAM